MSVGTYAEWLRALGQNESGNNYAFVSSLGYLGRFQFGEEALQAIGFYHGDATPWAIDFQGAWTDKVHALGVWDKASFLASSAAQDAAGQAWFGKIHEDASAIDVLKYEGQVVAGIPVTMSGILAGAHLVGVWNLKSFLETGGAVNVRDGYGTPVSEYLQRFGGYDTPFGGGSSSGSPVTSANDMIQGGDGADTLSGGEGDDTVAGGAGHNILRGDGGADLLKGGWQFDDLHGGQGADTLHGGLGDDWVVGGQDGDQLFGDDGGDLVLGNMGGDTLDGGWGDDIVRGGQGDDVVRGGGGADFVSGDRGDDVVLGGAGADTFHTFHGAGLDTVLDFDYAEGDRVRLLVGTGYNLIQAGPDTVIDLSGGDRMVLAGVTFSMLPSDWIV
jgi:hypothetical protein